MCYFDFLNQENVAWKAHKDRLLKQMYVLSTKRFPGQMSKL